MVATMDTVLGANPLGVSFITGLGAFTPQDPLQGEDFGLPNSTVSLLRRFT